MTDSTARFWARVQRGEPDECWPWLGSTNRKGYGNRTAVDGRIMLPHRAAYELVVGPIPAGLTIDHLCQNPPCCNPAHMEPVTASENSRRKWANRTHCNHGHELTPDNIVMAKVGDCMVRRCRVCVTRAHAAYYRRHVIARRRAMREAG